MSEEQTVSMNEISGRLAYLMQRITAEVQQQTVLAGQLQDAHARIAEYEKAEASTLGDTKK